MTGRRSHGRLSALNGVVHQGSIKAQIRQAKWKSRLIYLGKLFKQTEPLLSAATEL